MKHKIEEVRAFAEGVMRSVGLEEHDARVFADCLLQSEIRGIASHGITRLKAYSEKIRDGHVDGTAKPAVLREQDATLLIDGKNGPGAVVGKFAIERCIEKAGSSGACFAAVNNSSHYGFGGYYAMAALKHNMIGLAVCNSDAAVAPFGGTKPMLGTNPLSIAIPGGKLPDLVLDMATSVVAKGKVNLAQKLGKSIPKGWIIDEHGNETENPADIIGGALLPFGGVKGYAIALIIDVLVCGLAGAKTSPEITSFFAGTDPRGFQNVGFFLGAIDIAAFVDIETFRARVDALFSAIKASPAAPGFEQVMIPGEIEQRNAESCARDGIELSEPVVAELRELAQVHGIPAPFL